MQAIWLHCARVLVAIRRAVVLLVEHDGLNLAQSASYSAMVALFPGLIVAAATVALLPELNTFKIEAGAFFDEVLPGSVFGLLNTYFGATGGDARPHTARALVIAAVLTLIGGSATIATLMEGLHRAACVPAGCWGFWQKRGRSLLLVPLSLVPLAVASVLVVFGRIITEWIAEHLVLEVRPAFFGLALAVRWAISLGGVAGLTALIYHMAVPLTCGTSPRRYWVRTLPGAVLATAIWFVSTLVFGWYVTTIANYNAVYGSLGAGIALLFWLYLVFLSVLVGAEFNDQLDKSSAISRRGLMSSSGLG
jgi:membrane protein